MKLSPTLSATYWVSRIAAVGLAAILIPSLLAAESLTLDRVASSHYEGDLDQHGRFTRGDGILGDEREETLEHGVWRWVWDGRDSAPDRVDGTGLGGLDLSCDGACDRFELAFAGAANSQELRLTVMNDEAWQSTAKVALRNGRAVVSFTELAGVDLTAVGAIVAELRGAPNSEIRLSSFAVAGSGTIPAKQEHRRSAQRRSEHRRSAQRGPATPLTVVTQIGDTPTGGGGNMVSTLENPFTDGNGKVGFVGDVDDGGSDDPFIWYDTGVTFLASSVLGSTLTGGEATMGVSDAGDFVYSPSVDGDDGLWTDDGLLIVEEVQAPGFPVGTVSTFHSRPTMNAAGAAFWVAGFNDAGGTSSLGRMIYTSADHQAASIAVVLRSDDLVGGVAIDRPSGVGFDYQFSDDGSHHIQELLLDTGSTADDGIIYVDGTNVAQEASPSGDGDNWDNFDVMSINNAGDYVFSGDTDGATATDEFIAYNGAIALREGDVVDGFTLTSTAFVRVVSINNSGQVAHAWSASGTEALFFACDGADLAGSSQLLATVGDTFDTTGDLIADATLTDFNASTILPGLQLAEDGKIHLNVDLDFGGGDVEANVAFDAPSCGVPVAINEIRIDQGGTDDDEYFELTGPAATDLTGLTYLVIGDGTGASGTIEEAIALAGESIPGDGFWLAAEDGDTLGEVADLTVTMNFENGDNVTHLLVSGFTGAVGDDLDTNDDCVLDILPWASIVDGVALVEEANPPAGTECHYGAEAGAMVGPDGSFVPGHVGRDPDFDGPWIIGDFDPMAGTDTPGASNVGTIPVELISFSVD